MKFDVAIIGGGLAGLTAGLSLQRQGLSTVIISSGQNAMHFSSGAFELLSRTPDGMPVDSPLEDIPLLPGEHPYSKIGLPRLTKLIDEVPQLFASAGIKLQGHALRNSFRITPTGTLKRAWLALEDVALLPTVETSVGRKVLLVNLAGYPDFFTSFIAEGLEARGSSVRICSLKLPEMEALRNSPSEMRSVNIARVMDTAWKSVVDGVKLLLRGEDSVILPQVFGLKDETVLSLVRGGIPANVLFVGTMPPSVPGIRAQMKQKAAYEKAGGTTLMGDSAVSAVFDGGRIVSLRTRNLGDHPVEAREFILATGGFFSKGLSSTPSRVYESLFSLDVDYDADRNKWYAYDFFTPQPYLDFGVRTDNSFRAVRDGEPIENLRAVGSILGGAQAFRLGCGGGVAILSALAVAEDLSNLLK